MFIGPNGQIFFMEMKREGGGKLSVMQQIMIADLLARGVSCHVVSDVEVGKALIDRELCN
jgi:hypothetical protein